MTVNQGSMKSERDIEREPFFDDLEPWAKWRNFNPFRHPELLDLGDRIVEREYGGDIRIISIG
jgi:hypothetical protein